jgi:hypothetical protein
VLLVVVLVAMRLQVLQLRQQQIQVLAAEAVVRHLVLVRLAALAS